MDKAFKELAITADELVAVNNNLQSLVDRYTTSVTTVDRKE